MKLRAKAVLFAATILAGLAIAPASARTSKPRPAPAPNILLVLVDDMGFSDIGAFGGEIRTPNLDMLAKEGLRFANFHATPVCAPTRAELLTGVDHHQTGIGNFPELIQPNQKGHPGYEGFLTEKVATVAERLEQAGYQTMMSGKWHLGYDPHANPARRGFEHSFALLGGGHNHFGINSNYKVLIPNAGTVYTKDGETVPIPQPFYSSDYFTDQMIDFLPAQAGGKPFFAYLAFTAPHYPLQAPPEDIARYHGRYDKGYDVLRAERLARLKALGLVPADVVAHPPTSSERWDSLPPERQRIEARKMEVYAAMVDRVDQNIGRLLATLKKRGLFDNTIIVFLSDNGAEGHELDKSVIAAAQGKRLLASGDNRLESIGSGHSYTWYGPNWAEAATTPSRLYKSFPTEGGTHVVAFISAPALIRQGVSKHYVSVRDITPTLLDFAGAPAGDMVAGRKVIPLQGQSIRPWLGIGTHEPPEQHVIANGEMFGRLYARDGRWKAIMIPPPTGPGRWQLYDVTADPGEVNDLASAHPRQLARLKQQWERYARDKGVVVPEIPGN